MGIFDYFKKQDEARLKAMRTEGQTFLVMGLGNKGMAYDRTWHNLGYMVMDRLEAQGKFVCRNLRFKSLNALERVGDNKVLFMRPQTYMNRSGESLRGAMDFYQVPIEHCLVLVDDLDLPLGKLRLRSKGSAGSHNGLKSLIAQGGSDQFPRLRLGFGPKPEHIDLADHVLARIPSKDQQAVDQMLDRAAQVVWCYLRFGLDAAMRLSHQA